MAVLTLTTDCGVKDGYIARLKGQLLSGAPGVQIVDITHEVKPYNVFEGAFVLANVYEDFPEGSIHLFGVNTLDRQDIQYLAVEYNKHYFIGPDNGFFGLILRSEPDMAVKLPGPKPATFPMIEYMLPACIKLIKGADLASCGAVASGYQDASVGAAQVRPDAITGNIVYIDHYGNAITNVNRSLFEKVASNRDFSMDLHRNYSIQQVHEGYYDVEEGEKVCFFNHIGLLEIAINKGNAAELLGFKEGDDILIKFHSAGLQPAQNTAIL